jgi:chemotaxis protein MotA
MDIATILGFIMGFGSLYLGYTMDGGDVGALMMLSAIIIVLGGSIGGLFMSYGLSTILKLPKLFIEVFLLPKSTIAGTIEYLVLLATKARQGGLLSLEKEINNVDPKKPTDPFLKRGVLMVVDGTDSEKISEILQNDIYIYETDRTVSISMFDSLAGFAPTFGMVGTVVGLIMMLGAGMSNPDELTKAIGVAFITTLYGVLLANLFFAPCSSKLRNRMSNYRLEKEMIIEAICAIRNGINPRLLQEQLSSYYILGSSKQQKAAAAGGDNVRNIKGDKGKAA